MILNIIFLGFFIIGTTIIGRYLQFNKKLKSSHVMNFSLGILINAYVFIVFKKLEMNWIFSLIPMCSLSLHFILKHNIDYKHKIKKYNQKYYLILLSVIILLIMPNLIQSLIMGIGNSFPKDFFGVDCGLHLQFVFQLCNLDEYPPRSLDFINRSPQNYHFGIHAISAMISNFTNILPHRVFLTVLPVLLNICLVCIIINFFKKSADDNYLIPIFLLVIFYLTKDQSIFDYVFIIFEKFIPNTQSHETYFNIWNQPHNLLACICLVLIMTQTNIAKNFNELITPLIIVSLLVIVKIPFVPLAGLGMAFQIFHKFLKNKDKQILLIPIIAFFVILINYFLFSRSSYMDGIISFSDINLKMFFKNGLDINNVNNFFNILISLSLFSIAVFGKSKISIKNIVEYLGYLVPSLLIISFIYFPPNDAFGFYTFQITKPLYFILPLVILRLVTPTTFKLEILKQKIVLAYIIFISIPGLYSYFNYNYMLLTDPSKGYEHCDNRALGEILLQVPLDGSIIVTNDIRYPANNFRRTKHNYQFAGLFGHENVATNFQHMQDLGLSGKKGSGHRVEVISPNRDLVNLLGEKKWDDKIIELCLNFGVTHVVIHKETSYPDNIPFLKTYENHRYILYKIQ